MVVKWHRKKSEIKLYEKSNLYDKKYGYLYITPAVLILVFISILPMFYSIGMSLTNADMVSSEATRFIGLGNYIEIFTNQRFWAALLRTVIYVVCVVSVEFLIGFVLAVLFQVSFRGKKILRSVIMLPMVATPIAAAYMWRIMYNPNMGIINYLLEKIGITGIKWASDASTALVSTMIVDVWQWTPFLFLIFSSGIAALPSDPFEAAIVDGAGFLQTVRYIMLPLLKPVLTIGLLFRVVDSFKAFDTIYVLTAGGPGTSTETLNLLTFLTGFKHFKIGQACAFSLIMVYIILFICNSIIKRGQLDFN